MTHPPITDEMVERASEAGYEAYRMVHGKHWKEIPEGARKSWRPIFHAALEAALSGKEE